VRVLVQRVSAASVEVDGQIVGEIGKGILLLVGVTHTDTADDAIYLASKVANLRIFEDDEGKLNRSAADLELSVLVVSQFTLYGNVRKGRRPSFIDAAQPDVASPLIEELAAALEGEGLRVERGQFRAHMAVHLTNDGPVTIWLDTAELRASGNL
jgi:D-aminoacyl-tRNA deacylase